MLEARALLASPAIITVAGNLTLGNGYSGDGGPPTSAQMFAPRYVAVDAHGNLFIADSVNHVIREVNASTGVITTVAGGGTTGYPSFGDGGPATGAELAEPTGVVLDAKGNLFLVDSVRDAIREVLGITVGTSTPAPSPTPAPTPTPNPPPSPGPPGQGVHATKTHLRARPRSANPGQPVALTATVKALGRRGGSPGGSVTFLDGAAVLGSVPLRAGKASLTTGSLPVGPNHITLEYVPTSAFAPSTTVIVETVRPHHSRSKPAWASEYEE